MRRPRRTGTCPPPSCHRSMPISIRSPRARARDWPRRRRTPAPRHRRTHAHACTRAIGAFGVHAPGGVRSRCAHAPRLRVRTAARSNAEGRVRASHLVVVQSRRCPSPTLARLRGRSQGPASQQPRARRRARACRRRREVRSPRARLPRARSAPKPSCSSPHSRSAVWMQGRAVVGAHPPAARGGARRRGQLQPPAPPARGRLALEAARGGLHGPRPGDHAAPAVATASQLPLWLHGARATGRRGAGGGCQGLHRVVFSPPPRPTFNWVYSSTTTPASPCSPAANHAATKHAFRAGQGATWRHPGGPKPEARSA